MASIAVSSYNLQNVFVYGSLMADEVVHALLNRVPQSSPAILNNFHRFSIKGRVYPAIIPVDSKHVTGRVFFGVTPPELEVLDIFEDVEYERVDVEVSLGDSAEKLQAYTYVWENKNDPQLYGDWDFEAWKRAHMKDFVAMTMDFMKELEQPESKPRVATYEQFYEQDKQNQSAL
ncbi:unnamed protein product [Rhodiola kirilowii]